MTYFALGGLHHQWRYAAVLDLIGKHTRYIIHKIIIYLTTHSYTPEEEKAISYWPGQVNHIYIN